MATDLPVHLLALSLTLWIWGISLARAHTFTLFSLCVRNVHGTAVCECVNMNVNPGSLTRSLLTLTAHALSFNGPTPLPRLSTTATRCSCPRPWCCS